MRHLSGFDAVFIYDDGPQETQHTLKVLFLSEEASLAYDFEYAKAHVGTRLVRLPPLRWQVMRIPFDLHHPVWVEAKSIDLDYHVRQLRLPEGAGREELCREISGIAAAPLDHARPLWETWFLEGYEGNRVVIVLKVSHALADGGSFVDLFEHAMFSQPTEPALAEDIDQALAMALPQLEAHPSRARLLWVGVRGLLRDLFVRLPRLGVATLRAHRRLREVRDLTGRPGLFEMPQHAFGGALPPGRTFYFTTVSLASAREIARTFSVTINDVVLSVAAGAMRKYLMARDALPEAPLVGSMAASIREPEQRGAWGNRVTNRALRLPTQLADPVERLRFAHIEAAEVKRDVALHAGAQFVDWIELAPPVVVKAGSWLMRRVVGFIRPPGTIILSNVRGPSSPLYTTHGPVENLISVGHVKNAASINITVWSYVEKLNFGMYTYSAFPNIREVADGLEAAFAELLDAAQRYRSEAVGEASTSPAP